MSVGLNNRLTTGRLDLCRMHLVPTLVPPSLTGGTNLGTLLPVRVTTSFGMGWREGCNKKKPVC